MSQQLTFADSEFSSKRRQTRKEKFLSRMDKLLPWPQLLDVIEPVYPKVGYWSDLDKFVADYWDVAFSMEQLKAINLLINKKQFRAYLNRN